MLFGQYSLIDQYIHESQLQCSKNLNSSPIFPLQIAKSKNGE